MTRRQTMLGALMVVGCCLALQANAVGQTKLAIHATQAEVDEWKKRLVSGPYADDWSRIIANANAFKASPTGQWAGNQLSTAWLGQDVYAGTQPPNKYPSRTLGDKARDSGFVYLVTGDKSYRDPVVTLLLKQAGTSGTDFSNSTKWPINYLTLPRNGFGYQDFEISNWGRRLIYAYSYVRSSMTSSERSATDTWFINVATWVRTALHDLIKSRFPNRLSENWGSGTCGTEAPIHGLTHYDGFTTFRHQFPWDNRLLTHSAFIGAVGAVTGDSTSRLHARVHFKEWMQVNVYPDGTIFDQDRWNDKQNPQIGWMYATTALGTAITIADHLARAGDTSLYDYSTSNGCYGSTGGPKTLLKVLQRYANLALGNVIAYASKTPTSDPALRIDPDGTEHYVSDLAMAQANLYYHDPIVKKALQRSTPSNPNNGGYNPWGGDWGNLPGVRFMFGQMDNIPSPYSSTSGSPLSSTLYSPTSLVITK
jgi:hypothetical protein